MQEYIEGDSVEVETRIAERLTFNATWLFLYGSLLPPSQYAVYGRVGSNTGVGHVDCFKLKQSISFQIETFNVLMTET